MALPLPCIVCKRELEPALDLVKYNQPSRGTSFESHGQYGSTVWDPMDGSYIQINICDPCLIELAADQMILEVRTKRTGVIPDYEYWEPRPWEPINHKHVIEGD